MIHFRAYLDHADHEHLIRLAWWLGIRTNCGREELIGRIWRMTK